MSRRVDASTNLRAGDPTSRRGQSTTKQHVWLRADGVLPDDPVLHACVVTYASDMTLLDTALRPHGGSWDDEDLFMASLDHAMWFHRPVRADEWHLYEWQCHGLRGGRGMTVGNLFSQDGRHIASIAQEVLQRERRSKPTP